MTSATTAGATTASAFLYNPLDQVLREVRSDGGTAISWSKANADAAGNVTDRCVWNSDPGTELCKAVGASFTATPAVHSSSTSWSCVAATRARRRSHPGLRSLPGLEVFRLDDLELEAPAGAPQ